MLLKVLDIIRRENVVSLKRLASILRVDEAALQPMLDVWIQKGTIRFLTTNMSCQRHCSQACSNQVYQAVT